MHINRLVESETRRGFVPVYLFRHIIPPSDSLCTDGLAHLDRVLTVDCGQKQQIMTELGEQRNCWQNRHQNLHWRI